MKRRALRPGSTGSRIIDVMKAAGQRRLLMREIRNALPYVNTQTLYDAMQALRRRGMVDLIDGLWGLATDASLAQRAEALIASRDDGTDSTTIAAALGVTSRAVEAALRPAVDAHRFVTCRRHVDGVSSVIYRASAGATMPTTWGSQRPPGWIQPGPGSDAASAATTAATATAPPAQRKKAEQAVKAPPTGCAAGAQSGLSFAIQQARYLLEFLEHMQASEQPGVPS